MKIQKPLMILIAGLGLVTLALLATDGERPRPGEARGIYINDEYGFQFAYPVTWRVGDNSIDYGTWQLFNYELSDIQSPSRFAPGQNKIEAVILPPDWIERETDDYEKLNVRVEQMAVFNQPTSRETVEFINGEKLISYRILLPNQQGRSLRITIYGDSANFYVLDELVSSIKWR